MPISVSFSPEQVRTIEKKYNVLVIPDLSEIYTEQLFHANLQKIGFSRVSHGSKCYARIWGRIGQKVDFKGVDYVGWKENEPYTVELETWASFARFHVYMDYLDYIVCLQRDEWYGGYGKTEVIELWRTLRVKEILTKFELGSFLYENDPDFKAWSDELMRKSYERKMGIT